MAVHFSSDEIATATRGTVLADAFVVDGASIDSRSDIHGRLFVPVVAERDGHDFIDAALRAGATAYLTARSDHSGRPGVGVADTLTALSDLGRAARARIGDRVIGVTGSVGKTSTKDLLGAVLASGFVTHANRASFNNEMGVPLTLVEAPDNCEALVCEMGARGIGHIASLCDIARPTIGVVTAIAEAHLEMFGSIEGVALAKGELVEALPASGTAVLNADDERVAALGARTAARVLRYGIQRSDADVHATGLVLDAELRPSFDLHTPWGVSSITLDVHGAHQASNALAAIAAGLAAGVDLDAAVEAVAHANLSPMRMDVRHRHDGMIVIDDTYNANPTSMAAALRALAALDAKRRIAVLGEMAELGADADDAHLAIAELARSLGIGVIAVGTTRYGPSAHAVGDTGEVVVLLGGQALGGHDAILVKGSRVVGLEDLARKLAP